MTDWIWYGNAGHFCASSQCRFHLCTEIGDYLISTVGEYYRDQDDKEMSTLGIGSKDFYETYVFRRTKERCKCGCGLPDIELSEIDGTRYATPREANEGHIRFCEKYSELS